jgi:putative oxidoreductase
MFKNLFNPGNYTLNVNLVLLLLRITIGVFMLTHGYSKFVKLFGDEPVKFSDPLGVGMTPSLVLAVFAEVFCSILIMAGFAVRVASIPIVITMFVIIFIVQADAPFSKKELPGLYSVLCLSIAMTGA